MQKDKKIFYGWWIVLSIAIMTLTTSWTIFGVVLKQLMEQFQTGRGTISIAQSITTISGGIAGIISGKLLYRYKPRLFMLWGSIVSGVSAILLSLAPNLWYFYVFSCLSGMTVGFYGVISTFTLLSKWFTRKWGTAVGISQAGGFLGIMAITPLLGLIAENFGWRATYLFSGFLVLAINVPFTLFIIKDNPQSMGLLPDGDKPGDVASSANSKSTVQTNTESNSVPSSTRLLTFLKRPALWLMWICFVFTGIGYGVVTTHEVSFLTDMNISATVAASALGFTVGLTAVASLAGGWLADKLASRYVTILFLLIDIVAMLIVLQADTMPEIWLFVILFGLGIGASGVLLPIVTRDIFGTANFSALFGITNVVFVGGYAVGGPLAGFIFDATGSYHFVFIIVSTVFVGAILAIYFAFNSNPKPLVRTSISKRQP